MLDNSTPRIRALVKTVFFVLSILIAAGATVAGLEYFGLAIMGTVSAVLIFCYLIYLAYSITLAQEQYRQGLKDLQSTIRGE
jgi:hypothetical protein